MFTNYYKMISSFLNSVSFFISHKWITKWDEMTSYFNQWMFLKIYLISVNFANSNMTYLLESSANVSKLSNTLFTVLQYSALENMSCAPLLNIRLTYYITLSFVYYFLYFKAKLCIYSRKKILTNKGDKRKFLLEQSSTFISRNI